MDDDGDVAAFRREIRDWLAASLTGEFAAARGLGGPGREHEAFGVRIAWERRLADGGWTCLGWPAEHGGRAASLPQQVVFHEEYARARAPHRVGHIGEGLIGPTIIDFGTPGQKRRFLAPIRADVAVNNAGLGGTAALTEMTDEEWSRVLDVTLTGTMRCTRAALRQMIPQRSGVIVNKASVLGWRAQAGQAHYAAAKAGVMALTRCAAAEAAPSGVRVNAVSPSLATHPFLTKVTSRQTLEELTGREAFGRGAQPSEVANVIVFLASDYSSYMTGEIVSVSSQHP